MPRAADAVVIGAGPNGLVAANLLADAGWDVVVLEANEGPGGAVRTAEVTCPGFRTDLFSAFYPLAAASPVLRALELDRFGLQWTHAPAVVANPLPDRPAAMLWRDPARTAGRLEADAPGDGDEWLAWHERWERVGGPLVDSMLSPFPPVRAGLRLAVAARGELADLARLAVLPVRRMVQESFDGEAAAVLLAGNALHADLTPEAPPSALLGWLLVALGQTVGFPVPVGGAERIADALAARLAAAGGELRCASPASRVTVAGGRATGVITESGETFLARRAVIAACDAAILYRRLLPAGTLPTRFVERFERLFHRGDATVKVDWALGGPIPWTDHDVRGAGTVHIADGIDELTITAAQLAAGRVPDNPFLLLGQMTTADPTRSPAGTESAWAYTHLPQRQRLTGDALRRFVDRIEERIEERAPGFGACIRARHVQGPAELEAANASLVGGDIGGGTSQLHQQLVFRPVPGFARAATPVSGLYLGSSSAHPGGAVHGACGANAARAALGRSRLASVASAARRALPGARASGRCEPR